MDADGRPERFLPARGGRLGELEARREGQAVVVVTGRAHQTGRFGGQLTI